MTGGAGAHWSPEVFAHMPLHSPGKHILTLLRSCSYRKQKNTSRNCVGSCRVTAVTNRQTHPVSPPPATPQPCLMSTWSRTQATFGHGTVLVHKIPTCYWVYFSLQTKNIPKLKCNKIICLRVPGNVFIRFLQRCIYRGE